MSREVSRLLLPDLERPLYVGLTASFVRWLEAHGEQGLEPAALAFETLSTTAKTVQFKLARMANLKRDVDITPLFETMERAWDEGMGRLVERYGA